ncbi:TIGR03016 family PEP-CTERM system-associated outer membrane protein [Niveibacterium sp. SC-1]|uniref:TIGR03016 family PEP-CTERM system-associated outer membrane protein n=1 Tax=Niveibacterium sp. SC-1 TaxID=3135646 RepID=UPI00311D3886
MLLSAASLVTSSAWAQQTPVPVGGAYTLGALDSMLQGKSAPWSVTPEVTGSLRFSDNASQASDGSRASDTIVSVVPAVSLSGRTANSAGAFRFNLRNETYLRDSSLNHTDIYGGGQGSYNLYEHKVLVDGYVNLSRERLSIFAPDPSQGAYSAEGQTNIGVYSISPYARWNTKNELAGELRYTATYTDSSNGGSLDNQLRQDVSFSLGNAATPRPFGWSLLGSNSLTDYETAQSTRFSSVRLTGVYAVSPLLRLRGVAGYESNNLVTAFANEQAIYGGGLEWTPSPRTRLFGQVEKRFFGTGYDVQFNWRGPRSGISARFSRDVSSTSSTLSNSDLLNLYLSYLLALQNEIPDPVERARRVSELWAARGLPTTIGQGTSYVSQNYYLEQRAQIGATLNGTRNTLGVTLGYNDRQQIIDDALLSPSDSNAFDRTRETTLGAYFTHALTPIAQLSLAASLARSRAEGSAVEDSSRRRTVGVTATTRLGVHTTGSLTYTYSSSSGATEYEENSIGATLGMRF